ncbi:MAG TPA: hypothetical protein PLJ21_12935 [Pseudobdellovibrionaceae bacterium]|nr:hypothetical protein [Pseudobdellovibrionaceae bacterium]
MEKRTPPGRSSRSKFGPWTNLPETPGGLGDLALEMTQDIQQGTAYPALISEAQYITYIIPIRKAALNLSASGRGRDFLSGFTRERAITLIRTIKSANHFLENLAQYDQFLGSVNNLLLVKESLESQYEMWIPQHAQP